MMNFSAFRLFGDASLPPALSSMSSLATFSGIAGRYILVVVGLGVGQISMADFTLQEIVVNAKNSQSLVGVEQDRLSQNIINAANSREQPSLFAILQAEFTADRGNMPQALAIYKQQSNLNDAAPVFERALGLSLQHEPVTQSLAFANAWQQHNPAHVPALFYVTHLALKAHEYELASQKLTQILDYDPNADLSQILVGIYPTDPNAQIELLATLQNIDSKNNPSLLVLKAGLLLQVNQPNDALVEINKVLKKYPKTLAFLTLKADILQALVNHSGQPQDQAKAQAQVVAFLQQARRNVPDNKSLFLYQTRYLLQNGKSADAWQQLNAPQNAVFLADEEIKLLAGLVGIDIERYSDADALLLQLVRSPNFKDQANYYLGISHERQLRDDDAIRYYGNVMQPSLVMQARKKQVALLTQQHRYAEAVASMEKLRTDFDEFIPQSYILQASILSEAQQPAQALAILNDAQQRLPDNTDIMFAKVLLLPDDDNVGKEALLEDLLQLAPNNIDYQLEYAQILVNLKKATQTVDSLLMPLINDKEVGLKARQLLSQQAIHQKNSQRVISLLEDNFDIVPDVISGLLLRQAYLDSGNQPQAQRIDTIMKNELNYNPESLSPINQTPTNHE